MSYILNKEDSLKKLREFCSQTKVVGWISNMWYNSLKDKNPLEFILYTQFSTKPSRGREYAKKVFSNKVNLKIQKLLENQLEQEDVDYLNSINTQLSERISQKEKQLKNWVITKDFSNFNL